MILELVRLYTPSIVVGTNAHLLLSRLQRLQPSMLTVQQLLDPSVKGQSVLTGEGRKHRQFIHSVTIVADRKRIDEG